MIEAQRFNEVHALMLVHSFSPNDAWLADYVAFAEALGGSDATPDAIVSVGERQGIELTLGWVKGEAAFLYV